MNSVVFLTGQNNYANVDEALRSNPWPLLQQMFREKRIFQGEIQGLETNDTIMGKVEKFFVVWIGLTKARIPFQETGLKSRDDMIRMLGSKVPVLINDLNISKELVLLSMTRAKVRLGMETRKTLKPNSVHLGVVERFTSSRAIVNIGGVDTVLLKEDIAWEYINHPRHALKIGQEIQIRVVKVEEDGTVYVSKKILTPDPWLTITKQFNRNDPYIAEVTGSTSDALFLKLPGGVAAMATYGRQLPNGHRVVVQVTSVRTEKRRINCRVIRTID